MISKEEGNFINNYFYFDYQVVVAVKNKEELEIVQKSMPKIEDLFNINFITTNGEKFNMKVQKNWKIDKIKYEINKTRQIPKSKQDLFFLKIKGVLDNDVILIFYI